MCFVMVLIITSGFTILIQLRSTGNVLIDADRELEELVQTFEQPAAEGYLPENLRYMPEPDPESVGFIDTHRQNDDLHVSVMQSQAAESLKRNVFTKLKSYLTGQKAQYAVDNNNVSFTSSLIDNLELRQKILDLISKTDRSISLQYLTQNLSKQYFDGNYHPVLNELDRLERGGEIEGQVINGKVFYKKKPKEARKYIIRKGRNFRKYMG